MGGTHSAVNLKPFLNLLRLILKSQVSVVDPSIRKSDLNDLSSFYLSGHSSWLFSYIHALYSVTLQFLLLQSGVSSDVLNLGWLSNSMWQRWQLAGFQPCLCFLILSWISASLCKQDPADVLQDERPCGREMWAPAYSQPTTKHMREPSQHPHSCWWNKHWWQVRVRKPAQTDFIDSWTNW